MSHTPTVTLPVDPIDITDITDYEGGRCAIGLEPDVDTVIYVVTGERVSTLTIEAGATSLSVSHDYATSPAMPRRLRSSMEVAG